MSPRQLSVLLTGATGFLGSHLLRGLISRGIPVIVLKRSSSDTWRIGDLLPQTTSFDLDRTSLRSIFEHQPISVVLHAATAYGRKGETASALLETNLLLPLQLLELADSYGVLNFLNADSFLTKSTELPEGLEYYTLSKRHFREYGYQFAGGSRIRFTNVQIEHLYGPGDDQTKFIPSMIRTLQSNQAILELSPGEQRRDFIYVDDVVAAFLALLEHQSILHGNALHVEVGCGRSESLRSVVQALHQLCASETQMLFGAREYRRGELMSSHADTRVLRELGWVPRVPLLDGLKRTVRDTESFDASID